MLGNVGSFPKYLVLKIDTLFEALQRGVQLICVSRYRKIITMQHHFPCNKTEESNNFLDCKEKQNNSTFFLLENVM